MLSPHALKRVVCMAALPVLLAGQGAAAQQQLDTGTVMEAVARLKPGEFLWAPEAAPEGPVLLVVSLATQRAVLYRNGVPIGISTVSTGRRGYRTPAGVFTVLEKQIEHYSSLYDNAPMPYMQRLTWGGVALHGGRLPGYPASHGCIRLPLEFARRIYGVTRLGMTVVVTNQAEVPRIAPTPGLLANDTPAAEANEPFQWHPERAPTGPVSIVVSAADRRAVVLRNGVEIGSAPLSIDGAISGTTAYLLQSDEKGPRWLRVPLGGGSPAEEISRDEWRRYGVDPAFRQAVAAIVVPGTTVVVTADTLAGSGLGKQTPLIDTK